MRVYTKPGTVTIALDAFNYGLERKAINFYLHDPTNYSKEAIMFPRVMLHDMIIELINKLINE
jgi:hypothetical protein